MKDTYDFLASIEKRKMMAESVDVKQTTGSIKATGKDLGPDLEGRNADIKPKRAKELKQPANKEGIVSHSVKQCEPQKGKPSKGSLKVSKAQPAKELKQPKSASDTVKHSIKQCEPNSKNESIFVLAGIENILTSEDAKQGAIGALEIIKNYMGDKIDPSYQEFIDMFTNILKRDPSKAEKSHKDVTTLGQQTPKPKSSL